MLTFSHQSRVDRSRDLSRGRSSLEQTCVCWQFLRRPKILSDNIPREYDALTDLFDTYHRPSSLRPVSLIHHFPSFIATHPFTTHSNPPFRQRHLDMSYTGQQPNDCGLAGDDTTFGDERPAKRRSPNPTNRRPGPNLGRHTYDRQTTPSQYLNVSQTNGIWPPSFEFGGSYVPTLSSTPFDAQSNVSALSYHDDLSGVTLESPRQGLNGKLSSVQTKRYRLR